MVSITLRSLNRGGWAEQLGRKKLNVSFYDLGIDPALVHALSRQGISEPFEVQRESIPDAMLGRDICCRAPTGSGKTLAFGLPLISRTEIAKIEVPPKTYGKQIMMVLVPNK